MTTGPALATLAACCLHVDQNLGSRAECAAYGSQKSGMSGSCSLVHAIVECSDNYVQITRLQDRTNRSMCCAISYDLDDVQWLRYVLCYEVGPPLLLKLEECKHLVGKHGCPQLVCSHCLSHVLLVGALCCRLAAQRPTAAPFINDQR